MRRLVVIAVAALSACGPEPEPSNTSAVQSTVSISLPDEPQAPWAGAGGAVIERNCTACHSSEMIFNQPPLEADKWQATITKMRTVYKAEIPPTDDAALVAALVAIPKAP